MSAITGSPGSRSAILCLLILQFVLSLPAAGDETSPTPAPTPAPADDGKGGPPPTRVIVSGWYDLFVVDVDAGRVESVINIDETANDIAITADGRLALAATDAGLIHADLTTGKRVGLDDWGLLCSVELSEDDEMLAVLTCPGHTPFRNTKHTIRLEDLPGRRTRGTLEFSTNAHDIFLSPDGSLLFASNKIGRNIGWASTEDPARAKLQVLQMGDDGEDLRRMTRVATLAPVAGPGGRRQLVGVETPADGHPIILWLASFPRHGAAGEPRVTRLSTTRTGSSQGAAVSPDGRTLFVNCRSHLLIYDLAGRKETAWVELPNEHRWLALDHDGQRVFLTCTPDEGEGYLTEVALTGKGWRVSRRIAMPDSVNVIAMMPAVR